MVNRFGPNTSDQNVVEQFLFLQFFVIEEPLIYIRVCHGTPLTKIEKTPITCEKIK